ncbi:MAG: DUF2334 domain-containing protein [Ignavibacteria bacterium]|nr:DUF2334 domain-containing protein [Ignavibacteria bacterium]
MINSVGFSNSDHVLVIDDGGMIYSNPDNSGFRINFKAYERILSLAKSNEIKIPIACTAIFFDTDNSFSNKLINPDAEKILRLFEENPDHLQFWNHGLTHTYDSEYTEFFSYNTGIIEERIQDEHLKLSQQIFEKLGFYPKTFVPPGHAWQQDVTDALAKKYSIQNIVIREFEKKELKSWIKTPFGPYKKRWTRSQYLNSYFRLGLGISYDMTIFTHKTYRRTRHYINSIFPLSFIINRKWKVQHSVDHFFAHIQNFQTPQSIGFFDAVIKMIKKVKKITGSRLEERVISKDFQHNMV